MNAAQRAEDTGHAVIIDGRRKFLRRNEDGSYGPHFVAEPEKTSPPVERAATLPTRASGEAQGARIVAAIKTYVGREIAAALGARRVRSLADCTRGGWIAGQTYMRDDIVDRAGHTWVCLVANTPETPGHSSDWRQLWPKR